MKKFWQLLLTAMLAVLLLAACGNDKKEETPADSGQATEDASSDQKQAEDTDGTNYPYTINDAAGEDITFESAPEKVISLIPSNTETLFGIGAGDKVIAVTENDDYPEEATKLDTVGDYNVNVEKVISLKPDAVFAHEMMMASSEEGLNQIREAGIPVIVVPTAETFDETYESIKVIGEIMDKNKEADQIVEDMKAKVEEIKTKAADITEKKRVFAETSDAPEIYAPGKNTFPQQFLEMINAENVVTEDGWVMMSPETIVDENPDVILVMYSYVPDIIESVKKRDGFDTVTAVKEDQVVQVDENTTSRTGPRLADGLEAFAKAVYPEVFGE
ncbi:MULTISPECIES: ABC transporter substrate-binding protein [unclassified Sporosarcina]|uniref:ABC transporter substrate-binding protein n=1 Tax=unclassified Sporosarcina TaxID=2647733 RepID=UPI00203F3461|nr:MULTISPECIES: ABC transporter substrate-binding protein [unclassified Sporosarcina]GKV66847.1 putative ABC transporter substrate-binding lipoprotein YvrC [Sporosarcina sp. NCCP-2331]GLB57256.1 putative ABC transporter substrate-binding lipoprotein YvrC [Sporosarcina sp. NCCP-2378]